MIVTLGQRRRGVVIDTSQQLVVSLGQAPSGTSRENLIYIRSIRDSDLSVGNLIILNHNFGYHVRNCTVYNGDSELVMPDEQGNLSANSYFLNLASFRILRGDWEIILAG